MTRCLVRLCAALCLIVSVGAGTAQAQSYAPSSLTPSGACCLPGYCCAIACRVVCTYYGGTYKGDYTCCSPNPCIPVSVYGACCITNSSNVACCYVSTSGWCAANGGTYQGNGTGCSPTRCPQPPPPQIGACCRMVGTLNTCTYKTAAQCAAVAGTYKGNGSVCTTASCPQAPPPASGACCRLDWYNRAYCCILTQAQCTSVQGTYQGDSLACTPTRCPQPAIGACCIPASTYCGVRCVVTVQPSCASVGGTFSGASTTCSTIRCAGVCPCDWDQDGRITVYDSSRFTNDYFAGHGDFNGDGATNPLDLNGFASCFQGSQPGCFR